MCAEKSADGAWSVYRAGENCIPFGVKETILVLLFMGGGGMGCENARGSVGSMEASGDATYV
jgi:hypothetical protein